MDNLRLILLLIGILVVLGVYAWTRFQGRKRARRRASQAGRSRQGIEIQSDESAIEQELASMQELVASRNEELVPADAEQVIVLSVVAPTELPFQGSALVKAFEHNDLHYGEQAIYHRCTAPGVGQTPVFGVANLVKPGTFPEQGMEEFTTQGLTLFLQLPGPLPGVEAFDEMVNTAERLAVELGGELRDQQHSDLTRQTIAHIRDSILQARLRMATGHQESAT